MYIRVNMMGVQLPSKPFDSTSAVIRIVTSAWVLRFTRCEQKIKCSPDPATCRGSVGKLSYGGTYDIQIFCRCSARRWTSTRLGSRWCQSG